jgi:hypothetical protein
MSLRIFHLLFIVLSSLLALGTGFWALGHEGAPLMALGILSLAAGVVLIGYGWWFLGKLRSGRFL